MVNVGFRASTARDVSQKCGWIIHFFFPCLHGMEATGGISLPEGPEKRYLDLAMKSNWTENLGVLFIVGLLSPIVALFIKPVDYFMFFPATPHGHRTLSTWNVFS